MTVGSGIIESIAVKGFSSLLGGLAKSYFSRTNKEISVSEEDIRTDFREHMNNTFKKCMEIKTILNTNDVSKTLEIYVDQKFAVGDEEVDQYDMIDMIRQGEPTIITGTGGGGKSMFMRYLWLSFFENPKGKIPFFLELRNLNRYTHESIEDFIFHSIIKSGSRISQDSFRKALRAGEFVIFLDGFDEINFDQRERFEHLIIELQENNPKLSIVVTSRPDERFSGWAHFKNVNVLPLELDQAKALIERAPYNEDKKREFMKKMDEFHVKYRSFLSNPLLAYMMLVSFSHNPYIPEKKYLFYEYAFDALYHRHDLTKNFRRKFHCELPKEIFIRLVSFFCLKTYYDELYEFTNDSIIEEIRCAREMESISVDSSNFLKDMIESVCLIKLEGLSYTFTHRSFQEYFSAYCIARVAIRDVDKIFSEFAKRYSDSVMQMVYDMNKDLVREKYILPNSKKMQKLIHRKTDRNIYVSFAGDFGAEYRIIVLSKRSSAGRKRVDKNIFHDSLIQLSYSGELGDFYNNMRKIAELDALEEVELGYWKDMDNKFSVLLFDRFAGNGTQYFFIRVEGKKIKFLMHSRDRTADGQNALSEIEDDELLRAFKETGMYAYMLRSSKSFIKFVKAEVEAYEKVSASFRSLF